MSTSEPPDKSKKDPDKSDKAGKSSQTEKDVRKSLKKEEPKSDTGTKENVTKDSTETDAKKKPENEKEETVHVKLDEKATASTDKGDKPRPKKDSLMVPAEKFNDPSEDTPEEKKEVRGKSLADTRTRRPTTPIPVAKTSIKPDDTQTTPFGSPTTSVDVRWSSVTKKDSLKLPTSTPDLIQQRGSISDSRTRRPTTPIPNPQSLTRSESPMSSVPENTATSSENDPQSSGSSSAPNINGASSPKDSAPAPQSGKPNDGNFTTIIQRVDVSPCRFPGVVPKPLCLGSDIQITITSPDGATTTPQSLMTNFQQEEVEDHPIMRTRSKMHIPSPEPNIKPDDDTSSANMNQQ